ncbi:MAG: protein-tyrosine kinase [Bryobacterales bacterium]|jgi:capsular exopolysaccharide synthesis family protein|nr:protein-tyrosine kinase [Bryobacterales bacterium]
MTGPQLLDTEQEREEEYEVIQAGSTTENIAYSQDVMTDRFRFLRTHLRRLWDADKLKTLLITSPFPHDGKSTVALNLAISLSEGGNRKVLLIEADLHHPTVTNRLGLTLRMVKGFADCLQGDANVSSVIRRIEPIGIYLLSGGKPCAHPSELLQSDALARMIRSLRERFDWVLIDSPPVTPLSDALLLRQQTDATLLVIRSGYTTIPAVDKAVAMLGKKNIAGMILNGVEGLEKTYSQYYGVYGGQNLKLN